MNREILFRGKRVDNGEWIYGWITTQHKKYTEGELLTRIQSNTFGVGEHYVETETVGQFTGLTDKNGTKIFEGDIVCTRYSDGTICCSGDVQFCYGVYGAEWIEQKKNKGMVGGWGQLHNLRRFDDDIINNIEVIGNIYDNPEFMEERE